MTPKNNVVPLSDKNAGMKGKVPIFYTVPELLAKYPTIVERGWTAEDLEIWVSQDIISGKRRTSNDEPLEVEKESIEAFIEYHNEFLRNRTLRAWEGMDPAKGD